MSSKEIEAMEEEHVFLSGLYWGLIESVYQAAEVFVRNIAFVLMDLTYLSLLAIVLISEGGLTKNSTSFTQMCSFVASALLVLSLFTDVDNIRNSFDCIIRKQNVEHREGYSFMLELSCISKSAIPVFILLLAAS